MTSMAFAADQAQSLRAQAATAQQNGNSVEAQSLLDQANKILPAATASP